MAEVKDSWGTGNAYERYVGRWSRIVAREFVSWLAVPGGRRWLDVGCGTGELTRAILEQANPLEVVGVDPAAGFIEYARQQNRDARARFEVGDAENLPVKAGSLDAAVSGLALNFFPEPGGGITHMRNAVRSGRTVAAYVWDYADGMQFMRYFWEAVVALDPEATALDEGRRFSICNPASLERLFRAVALRDVEVHAIEIETAFANFDDFWQPFLGGQGPAPSYVASLPEDRREALRDRMRAALPSADDGRIHLTARAWAVKGKV